MHMNILMINVNNSEMLESELLYSNIFLINVYS